MISSYFNLYHSLWPRCSECPRFPRLWHQAPGFLSTSCPTIILDDVSGPEEKPPNTLATIAYSFYFYSIRAVSSSYPAGCSTTQKELCDAKLPFHSQNFSPCSFIPSTFSRLLMPGPPLLFLTDNTPTRLHSSFSSLSRPQAASSQLFSPAPFIPLTTNPLAPKLGTPPN